MFAIFVSYDRFESVFDLQKLEQGRCKTIALYVPPIELLYIITLAEMIWFGYDVNVIDIELMSTRN